MYGFVESLNISVSVAIVLYDFVHKLKNKRGFYLKPREREEVLIYWLKKEVKGFEKIEKMLKLKTQSAKLPARHRPDVMSERARQRKAKSFKF